MLMLTLLLQIPQVPVAAPTPSAAVDFSWLFLKMFLALGVVSILAILILKYLVPRLGFAKRLHGGKLFRVLSRLSLEQRKKLYLIQIAKRYLVIGTSESGIQMISEVPREDVETGEQ